MSVRIKGIPALVGWLYPCCPLRKKTQARAGCHPLRWLITLIDLQGEKDEVTKRLMTASAYDTHLKARAKGETPAQLDTLNREKKRKIGDAAETESKNDATNVVEVSPDAVKIDELASTTMSVSDDNRIATSSGTSAAGSPTPGDKRPANDLL